MSKARELSKLPNYVLSTVAELKLSVGKEQGDKAFVGGYYADGDGGGGDFYWDAASVEADNGGTIIQVTGITTGRWKRIYNGAVNVKWFGAKGDGVTDDSVAIQSAVLATSKNNALEFPYGKFRLTDEVILNKPITIKGSSQGNILEGYDTTDNGSYVVQTNISKMAFKLVADVGNYSFGQYAVSSIHFVDICVQGVNNSSKIVACIGVDTSINGGDFHIRGNSTTRCTFRYAVDAVNLTGIAYLNNFYQTNFVFSTIGFKVSKGAASDNGGQTRFFGCLFEFNTICLSLNESSNGGLFSLFGCTIGDSTTGISTVDEVGINISGCNFEANTNCGIYVLTPSAKVNSNCNHVRNITGNEFYNNGASIWFDKQATSSSDGNFNYPTRIDSNSFLDSLAIKLTSPYLTGFASKSFVIGGSNTGTDSTFFRGTQISSLFYGKLEEKNTFSKRYVIDATYTSGKIIDMLPLGLVPTKVRMYLTTNASSFTQLQLGDIQASNRYLAFDGANTALNTWVTWTPTIPQLIVSSANNQFRLIGTAGILGAQGVIEVDGYIT